MFPGCSILDQQNRPEKTTEVSKRLPASQCMNFSTSSGIRVKFRELLEIETFSEFLYFLDNFGNLLNWN